MGTEETVVPTEDDYFRYDDQADPASARLARTTDPAERAELLSLLGDVTWHQSQLHTAVFGYNLYSEDDPTPQAVWLADEARMLWILAEAEHARVLGPAPDSHWRGTYDARTLELAEAVKPILGRYAAGGRRRRLVRRMCDVWAGMTRGQATEGPWCLGLRMPWWAW